MHGLSVTASADCLKGDDRAMGTGTSRRDGRWYGFEAVFSAHGVGVGHWLPRAIHAYSWRKGMNKSQLADCREDGVEQVRSRGRGLHGVRDIGEELAKNKDVRIVGLGMLCSQRRAGRHTQSASYEPEKQCRHRPRWHLPCGPARR